MPHHKDYRRRLKNKRVGGMGVCLSVSKQEQISEQLNQSLCKQEVRRGYIIRREGSLCWGCGRYVVSSSLSKVYRFQED